MGGCGIGVWGRGSGGVDTKEGEDGEGEGEKEEGEGVVGSVFVCCIKGGSWMGVFVYYIYWGNGIFGAYKLY